MKNPFGIIKRRALAAPLPVVEEIEQFGADGEDEVLRLLRRQDIRVTGNVTVPHNDKYLEKDFLVEYEGTLFVLEVKNWKGEIGQRGDRFYQKKDNGEYKEHKSPVGTTNQFIHRMKKFYGIERPVWGVVVFVDPGCRLQLPTEIDGVALLPVNKLIAHLRQRHASEPKGFPAYDTDRILRCTHFYNDGRAFCKGILADTHLACKNERGDEVRLDMTRLRYLSVQNQPLRMRDKLVVTYTDGRIGIFYNRDAILTVACLDGTYRKIALNRVRHIVF